MVLKTKIKITYSILALLVAGFMTAVPLIASGVYADTPLPASLYLTPATSNVTPDSEVEVQVRENSGNTPVNAVMTHVSYDSKLFQIIGVDKTNAAFYLISPNPDSPPDNSGSLQLLSGALFGPPLSGDQLVAILKFRVLADSGSANISVAADSVVTSAKGSQNILQSTAGASFSVAKPPPTTPKPVPAKPPPALSAAKPPVTLTPLTIFKVKVSHISQNTAVISWQTSLPATVRLDYGATDSYGQTLTDNSLATNHRLTLSSANLIPGSTYYFRLMAIDIHGRSVWSTKHSFTTKGISLIVGVTDHNSQPLSGATVVLGAQKRTTGSDGLATFTGLAPGHHDGTIYYRGKITNFNATVNNLVPVESLQRTSVSIDTPSGATRTIVVAAIGLGLVLAHAHPKVRHHHGRAWRRVIKSIRRANLLK